MADDDQYAGAPGVDGFVEPTACEQVKVVGRLVEQEYVGTFQQQRGQAQQNSLPTGHLAHGAVQFDVAESERAECCQGPLLDVPVVADRLEVLDADVSGLDGAQRGAPPGDAQGLVDAERRVEGDVLRQVGEAPANGHRPL